MTSVEPTRFVQGRAMQLAGLRRHHSFAGAAQSIAEQWEAFRALGPIPHRRGGVFYGVLCGGDEEARTLEYMCAVEVAEFAPDAPHLGRMRVPEQHYAVFEHTGHASTISSVWRAIWHDWLPRSGHALANGPEFEVYGEGFDPRTGVGRVEIWASIHPAAGARMSTEALSTDGRPPADPDRIERQLRFAVEVDRLKGVLRQTRLVDGSRAENSAEHSWHLSLLAVVLAEHAGAAVDLARVMAMLLVHDVVEIDAGDAFCYDAAANVGKEERERAAAERLFGLLPAEQAEELRGLWEEFEAGETGEARYAVALDRLQPLLQNFHGGGGSWRAHGIARGQVIRRMAPIRDGAPALWPAVVRMIDEACAAGAIAADPIDGKGFAQ